MGDINVDANVTGINLKADINKLYSQLKGSYAKYKGDRRFNQEAYEELLAKYGETVGEVESLKNKVEELTRFIEADKIPEAHEIEAMGALAGLVGAKNSDGSLNIEKLMEFDKRYGDKK